MVGYQRTERNVNTLMNCVKGKSMQITKIANIVCQQKKATTEQVKMEHAHKNVGTFCH
jgi:hypothetical protein